MSAGLQRAAKQCGGITVQDRNESIRYNADSKPVLVFVTKQEATFRFGFVADAYQIPGLIKSGRKLPKKFRAAVRTTAGEIIQAKPSEQYHADIVRRISDDVEQEGYTYIP